MHTLYRFDKLEDKLWVAFALIKESGNLESMNRGLKRNLMGQTKLWKSRIDERDGRRRWLLFDALPARIRGKIEEEYGDLEGAYWCERLPEEAERRIVDGDGGWFMKETGLGVDKCMALAKACGWCRMMELRDWWKGWFVSKTEAWQRGAEAVSREGLYGFRVSNPRTLERRVVAWRRDGRESLKPKKLGNGNAIKGKESDSCRKRMVDLYASPLKPSYVEVAGVYNAEAKRKGWATYSIERVRQILNQGENRQVWVSARHGVNAGRGMTERIMRRRRPSHADALWSVDGTTVQLYSTDGKKLIKEWYVVFVTDAYSDYIIGWGLGISETSQVVLRALRMAVKESGGYVARVIQYDQGMANLSEEVQGVMKGMRTVGIACQPYNGKGKYVERIIGLLEQGVLRHFGNFVGGNVTGRSLESRANPDYLKRLLRQGKIASSEEVINQVRLGILTYNNKEVKRGVPSELYSEERPDDIRRMEYLEQVSLFWVERKHWLRYTNEGIVMEVERQRYYYHVESERGVEDYAFRKSHLGDRFAVRYDPDDLSSINIYDCKTGAWMATAVEQHRYGAIPQEWEEGWEGKALRKSLEERKRYIEEGQEKRALIRRLLEEEDMPELSFEMVHKDALNRAESKEVERLLEATGLDKERKVWSGKGLYYDPKVAKRLLNENH